MLFRWIYLLRYVWETCIFTSSVRCILFSLYINGPFWLMSYQLSFHCKQPQGLVCWSSAVTMLDWQQTLHQLLLLLIHLSQKNVITKLSRMQKDTSFSNTFGRYLICTSLQQTTVHAHALLLYTCNGTSFELLTNRTMPRNIWYCECCRS